MLIVAADSHARDGFAAKDRAIFRYHLGRGRPDYWGDPLAIEERYEALLADKNPTTLGQWLRRENASVRLLGLRRLLPVIRAAFALPAFDESHVDGLSAGDALAVLERFFLFQDDLKARYRREAELLVTYGPMPGRVHTYEREVGLWWNRARAQAFAGVAHWRGAIAASGAAKADFSLVDAMASNETEAHELEHTIESNRQEAESRAKLRSGNG